MSLKLPQAGSVGNKSEQNCPARLLNYCASVGLNFTLERFIHLLLKEDHIGLCGFGFADLIAGNLFFSHSEKITPVGGKPLFQSTKNESF